MPYVASVGNSLNLRGSELPAWRIHCIPYHYEIFFNPASYCLRVRALRFSEQRLIPTVVDRDIVFNWHDASYCIIFTLALSEGAFSVCRSVFLMSCVV